MTVAAFVGLGSNLDDPATQVATAAEELRGLSAGHFALSPLYASKAVGPGEQPDYVNAVAQLETGDAPLALLHSLQQIEQRHGRVRTQRWGARTLDLDLLLYGDLTLSHRDLTLPHPRIAERAFVLAPLHDLAPDVEIPGIGRPAALLTDAMRRQVWMAHG